MNIVRIEDIWLWVRFIGQNLVSGSSWFFRGQSNAQWTIQSTFEREYGTGGKSDSAQRQVLVENGLRAQERSLLTQFIRDGWRYRRDNLGGELSRVEWYSLMRHYGIPSRMVDFTESALVALYFALSDCDAKHDFAVWCVNSKALGNVEIQKEINKVMSLHHDSYATRKRNGSGRFEANREPQRMCAGIYYNAISAISANEEFVESVLGDEIDNLKHNDVGLDIIYFFPKHRNARMSAQAGLFLMPTRLNRSFMEALQGVRISSADHCQKNPTKKDITLTTENVDSLCVDQIIKFEFNADLKDEGRRLLQMANITPRTIYPDIEGIAKELRGEY